MMSKKMMMYFFAGMGFMGYMYLKSNPEMAKKMKEIGKEASKKMYNKLDDDCDCC